MTNEITFIQSIRSPSLLIQAELRAQQVTVDVEDFIERTQGLQRRFWANVEKSESGCWLWMATRNQKGYGQFSVNGHLFPAPRIAFQFSGQFIPEGLMILHMCDNPPCVNPEHLRIGTAKDNMQDCLKRGRFQAGREPRSKLTERHKREICDRLIGGEDGREIAPDYGIHWAHVYKIARTHGIHVDRARRLGWGA